MPAFVPQRNGLKNQALMFATTAHGDQIRKGNEHIPYIFHCVDVANEVTYHSGLPVNELEIASVIALLHDTVEDTPVTIETIFELFGDEVGVGVAALSKDDSVAEASEISKVEQLKESLGRITIAPSYVGAVKLADRVSNLKSFPAMWSREKIEQYLNESVMIAESLGHTSEGLKAKLLSRITEARMMLSIMS